MIRNRVLSWGKDGLWGGVVAMGVCDGGRRDIYHTTIETIDVPD